VHNLTKILPEGAGFFHADRRADRQAGRQADKQTDKTNLLIGYELFGAVCLSFSKIRRPVPKKNIPPFLTLKRHLTTVLSGKARNSHKIHNSMTMNVTASTV